MYGTIPSQRGDGDNCSAARSSWSVDEINHCARRVFSRYTFYYFIPSTGVKNTAKTFYCDFGELRTGTFGFLETEKYS